MIRNVKTHWSWFKIAVGTVGVLMVSATLSASESSGPRKPNVILVMTDDQGYGDLGCHGNTIIKTPNIDKLYTESVRLTHFHVSPTCAPTRAALMTGRYSLRTGIWHTVMGRSIVRRDEVTMADVFKASGYRTGIFGKWHLGDNDPYRPEDRGFNEALIHGGGGVGQGPDYWGNDYFDDTYFHNGKPQKHEGYCTDVWFDEAMKFIETNKDRPFFVYLPTNAPHSPFHVADQYRKLYQGNPDVTNPAFYGMITNIDENMARLLARLKTLGLEQNTILIFMTDNGSSDGVALDKKGFVTQGFNAGMRGKKASQYEGGHRVPCFIRWPAGGLGDGVDIDRLAAHFDLLPTLIELCELKKPQGVDFDGRSLVPLLKGNVDGWPDRAIMVDTQRVEQPIKWRRCVVMTQRWRLIDGQELYDMQVDPGQRHDVADQHSKVVAKLRQTYEDWWADVSERFDEYCEIPLGADQENVVTLMGMDWHMEKGKVPPWSQDVIRRGPATNGFWAVEVVRDGVYEIALRRWPVEIDQPITAAIKNGKAIRATQARLKVADVDVTQPIPESASAVTFRVNLKAGKTRLQSWFVDEGTGESRGAYYVYVQRLP